MLILALDLGTTTGWAMGPMPTGRVEHGVMRFDVKRGESPGARYLRFNSWLPDMVGLCLGRSSVGLIAYEQPHMRGGAATEVAAGFSTRVQEFCAAQQIEHVAVHSATLKKFATGKGNADKAAMIVAVSNRWGRVETDDEADAVALLHYAMETYAGSSV